jgi:hypothetical protein
MRLNIFLTVAVLAFAAGVQAGPGKVRFAGRRRTAAKPLSL